MARDYALIVGSSWIFRHGMKPIVRRLGLTLAGDGETYTEAAAILPVATPVLVVALIERVHEFRAGLEQLKIARTHVANAKIVAVVGAVSGADISQAVEQGVDAVLSLALPSRMLVNSLQLVMHGQKMFPTLPMANTADEDLPVPVLVPTLVVQDVNLARDDERADIKAQPIASQARAIPDAATAKLLRLESGIINAGEHVPTTNCAWLGSSAAVKPPNAGPLSEREWDILRCVARGGSNKSIGRELSIAETTVKVHIKSLLRKLGVSNRTQAAIWAISHGGPTLLSTETKPTSEYPTACDAKPTMHNGGVQNRACPPR